MYVKLSSGDELYITIRHEHFRTSDGKPTVMAWISGDKHRTWRFMTHRTTCEITDAKSRKTIATGDAKCSEDDQFTRRTGAVLALRKATARLDRDARRQIWERFMVPKDRAIPPATPVGNAPEPGLTA